MVTRNGILGHFNGTNRLRLAISNSIKHVKEAQIRIFVGRNMQAKPAIMRHLRRLLGRVSKR